MPFVSLFLVLVSVLLIISRLSSFVFLFLTNFFTFFCHSFSFFSGCLTFSFPVGFELASLPMALTPASVGFASSSCCYILFFLVGSSFSLTGLSWVGASITSFSSEIGFSRLKLICAALVDFLGNIFCTSCLFFVSATFSLAFDSFYIDYCVLVSAAFLCDLVKKDVMASCLPWVEVAMEIPLCQCLGFPLDFLPSCLGFVE